MAENLNLKTVDTVDTRPFKRLVMTIGELPTSFIESMTYYELLAWFVNYLETVIIPTVNNNAEATKELQDLFTELKNFVDNYFDNLDVQEEINNKLDEMVEDGTLQEIITTYIQANVAWTFDTVAEMKLSTNLIDGSYARTLGFYEIGDGGGSLYKIKTKEGTPDEFTEISIGDTLMGVLVPSSTMNILQFGAASGNITEKIQTIVDYCDEILFNPVSYRINTTVSLHQNSHLNLRNAQISTNTARLFYNFKSTDEFLGYNGNGNITIENGTIVGGGLHFIHGNNITVKGMVFKYSLGTHYIESCACKNFVVENCEFYTSDPNNSSTGLSVFNFDVALYDQFPWLDEENPTYDGTVNDNIFFLNNIVDLDTDKPVTLTDTRGVDAHVYDEDYYHTNIFIENNTITTSGLCNILLYSCNHAKIVNNTLNTTQYSVGLGSNNVICYGNEINKVGNNNNPVLWLGQPSYDISFYDNAINNGYRALMLINERAANKYSFKRLDDYRIASDVTLATGSEIETSIDYTKFNYLDIGLGNSGRLQCYRTHSYNTRNFQLNDKMFIAATDGYVTIEFLEGKIRFEYITNENTSLTYYKLRWLSLSYRSNL